MKKENKKGLRIIGGIILSGLGMGVAGLNIEWYMTILGFLMIIIGNILSIGMGGNDDGFNSNFKGR